VAKIAVSSVKVAVVLSDVGKSLVNDIGRVLRHFVAVRLLQFALRL
jgi:hypothetical protein